MPGFIDCHLYRQGGRLILQNDLGTTDAHVLVIHVEGLTCSLTYTDVHLQRLLFFQSLFARHAARTRITYQEESCLLVWCSTTDHVARYGGLTMGGFLSWSWDFHLRAPPRSPNATPDPVAEDRP